MANSKPGPVGTGSPEKTRLKFGIIPLSDCALLVMALTKGYFAKYGLEVSLLREVSWANIRDKVQTGLLDGAQMLAPMPIASTLGIGGAKKSMITAFNIGLNGNGITVSNRLYQCMLEAEPSTAGAAELTANALKKVVDADKDAGRKPLTFAMVFPFSAHNYQLRYWLASAGIDPDSDVHLTVVPPPQMVEHLEDKSIDGFCVGEPWNEVAVARGTGRTLLINYTVWNNSPEKVFGVTSEWAERYPNTHKAVLMALMETAEWLDRPESRLEAVETISSERYVNVAVDIVKMSMGGTFRSARDETPRPMPDFNVFHRYAANYPWLSQAEWFITQMYRWGQLQEPLNIRQLAAQVYRPEIYREVAMALSKPYPLITHKLEGTHAENWTLREASRPIPMGADRFIDNRVYDPSDLIAYINGFEINGVKVDREELEKLNRRN